MITLVAPLSSYFASSKKLTIAEASSFAFQAVLSAAVTCISVFAVCALTVPLNATNAFAHTSSFSVTALYTAFVDIGFVLAVLLKSWSTVMLGVYDVTKPYTALVDTAPVDADVVSSITWSMSIEKLLKSTESIAVPPLV